MEEGTGDWRRLHNKELYSWYFSPYKIWVFKTRRMRWTGHVAHMGDWVLMGRSEGKRPLGRPRHGLEDYIKKMGLPEVGWGAWTGMIWLRTGTGCGSL